MQQSFSYRDSSGVEASLLEFCITYGGNTLEQSMLNAFEALAHRATTKHQVSLKTLLNICNCRVIERTIPTAGRLEIDDTGFVIYLDDKMPETRKRFTIAHELAHILIIRGIYHKPYLLKELRQQHIWMQVERLCDFAAENLLMPKIPFISKLKECKLTSKGIADVCKYFGVSPESFFVRFSNIFNSSTIALCKSQKHTSRILPSIVRIHGTRNPCLVKEGNVGIDDLDFSLIMAAVKNSFSWNHSLVIPIKGTNTKILKMAILNSNSIHFKKNQYATLDGSKQTHVDTRNYDVILFYLPLDLISNQRDLIESIPTK